jgi:integrase
VAYFPEQAERIVEWISDIDPISARALQVMQKTGLRIREAVYLRAQDIEVSVCVVTLEGNVNHTKGGRPRQVRISSEEKISCLRSKQSARKIQPVTSSMTAALSRIGCANRCAKRVKPSEFLAWVHTASGKHLQRKTIKNGIEAGADDDQALLDTSIQLGHNRKEVTIQSYIPPQDRRI